MTAPRCTALDYIDFLLATPKVVSGTEAARVQPARPDPPAHDAFTRLLHRLEPDPAALWAEAGPLVRATGHAGPGRLRPGQALRPPYGPGRPLWSGKHQRVVQGIDLVTLLWTDGDVLSLRLPALNPRTARPDQERPLPRPAGHGPEARGLTPRCVCSTPGTRAQDNLKAIRSHGWTFLTPSAATAGSIPTAGQPPGAGTAHRRRRHRSSTWKGSGGSRCSGSWPATGTRNTG